MRVNSPVTQKEYDIRDGMSIVSRTDLKGRITYVNADFIEASGFEESELIGQPHNLVRHPDMPPAAFADLWETMKLGKPWTGMVKNRRKDGDHYWVQANVTPLREAGKVTGYMSVRVKPSRQQVEAAEQAYAMFREGREGGKVVHRGRVAEGGLSLKLGRISLHARMVALTALVVAGPALALAARHAGWVSEYWSVGLAFVAAVLPALLVLASLRRAVLQPLSYAAERLSEMSEGKLDTLIQIRREDEIGAVLEAARCMQIKLGFDTEDMRRVLAESQRVRLALENSEANVMIADREGRIVYLNNTLMQMFRRNEAQLREALPAFDVDRLVGANFDLFHKNPAHQRNMLASLKGAHRAEVTLAGLIFNLVASPVTDAHGRGMGYVVEWKDLTAIKGEIQAMVGAAARGDYSVRGDPSRHQGEFRDVVVSLNRMAEVADAGLKEAVRVLKAIAEGDLTSRMDGHFEGRFAELQADAARTVDNLSAMVHSIRTASEAIDLASREIASGNGDLSKRTEEQASSLEETAAAMEEIAATVKKNSDNTRQANELAATVSQVAVRGGEVVGKVVSTMSGISESSRRIADIIGVIDGIAFQTNILALNAAVEAARAGEQGRGFAVVASEVRSLAQRSASAAKEIKALIEDSVTRVDTGARLVDEAGTTMRELVASVGRVTETIADISMASSEQALGIEQVNQAVIQMDDVTQQNAALVEQAAAAAESLEQQARGLVESISVFRTRDPAAQAGSPAQARKPVRAAA